MPPAPPALVDVDAPPCPPAPPVPLVAELDEVDAADVAEALPTASVGPSPKTAGSGAEQPRTKASESHAVRMGAHRTPPHTARKAERPRPG
jgi:hypothetical protein